MNAAARPETRDFQAHTQKLLELMIHSVYAHREVFLRELISNASDAIDKVRFAALTDEGLAEGDHDYRIRLHPDSEARTLTIDDNGVGMSYDEVVENIGTIARSGTEEFAKVLERGGKLDAPELIGRFGVGFYSAFMVADEVTLETYKHGEEHAVRWHSAGDGRYTIERVPPAERGTRITLHLKAPAGDAEQGDDSPAGGAGLPDSDEDFCNPWTLRSLVRRYSDFVRFPVQLQVERTVKRDGEVAADDEVAADNEAAAGDATPSDDAAPSEAEDKAPETELVWETINSMKPLWQRPSSEIEDEEYHGFYKQLCGDWVDPDDRLHLKVEGAREYTALMFVPSKVPTDLYAREHRLGLQLYARHVFVQDECRELMPPWLRFVRGLIDSPDLPLSISREQVQQDRFIQHIRKHLTKKLLDRFAERLEDDRDAYNAFWERYGAVIKEGFHFEPDRKKKLAPITLFRTTADEGWTTLDEYLERKVDGQDAIFVMVGDDLGRLRDAPALEGFAARGAEVLLLTDPVDEIMLATLTSYQDHDLVDVARGDVDLDKLGAKEKASDEDGDADEGDERKGGEADEGLDDAAMKAVSAAVREALGEQVEDVRPSRRLTSSAAVLVTPDGALTPQLAQMMRAMGQEVPEPKRWLELNPGHAVVQALHTKVAAGEPIDDAAQLLYEVSLIGEGGRLDNPAAFARRVAQLLAGSLG
jgi:molecular chaperone HtpG